jgi:hypothetical protein
MFFGGAQRYIPIAILHAPSWLSSNPAGQTIQTACNNIAQITTFDLGQGSLIMGTFNVPANDDVNANGSNGAFAFGTLAGANAKYSQVLINQSNLLANSPIVAMAMEDAVVQTSDNFFFRRNGAANGIGLANPMIPNILEAALGTFDNNNQWVSAPLGLALARIDVTVTNVTSALPDGSYVKLEDAFAVYRSYVSAYLPIMATLTY